MSRRFLSVLVSGAILWMPSSQASADEWRWSGVERVVAISDVHGAFGAMTATLRNAGVLDEALAWSGGATHLVITGDILDRGPDSRKVMDLILRLEKEALDAGGRVHLLLGNHEIMNLVGDLRYVSADEYSAFAGDEPAGERERWFQAFLAKRPEASDAESLREDYDRRYPAGFFGLRQAFSTKGKYGPWLLSKPLMVVIDGTAFVHGGLSPLTTDLGLDGVNRTLKAQVTDYVSQAEVLFDNGILDPTQNFYGHPETLEAVPADAELAEPIRAAIRTVIELNHASIHGTSSPVWYRGSVGCAPIIEQDKLDKALSAVGAERVVIGHTPTMSRQVLTRLGGRVLEIDTGMLSAAYHGSGHALVIEGDAITVASETGSEASLPIAHPRGVGQRSDAISAEDLVRLLEQGELTPIGVADSDKMLFTVSHLGRSVTALFEKNRQGKRNFADLAAYRLDRLIGLDMVPVTVAREVGGKSGSLQFVPDGTQNEEQRVAGMQGGSAWCPLDEQWQAMYVFDSLIFNDGRHRGSMHYGVETWQLILTDHGSAFSTKRGLPAYVASAEQQTGKKLELGAGWRKALSALSDDVLTEQLADVLDRKRIKALAARRDDLLTH